MKKSCFIKSLAVSAAFLILFTSCSQFDFNGNKAADKISKTSFKDYTGAISVQRMDDDIRVLASKDDARVTGLDGEKNAADYISKRFENIGLKVEIQPFPVTVYRCSNAGVKITGNEKRSISAKDLTFSAPTGKDGLTADVVFADMGSRNMLSSLDVKGKIVLMKRGGDYFFIKTANAAQAGAAGTIYYDPAAEEPVAATLVKRSDIPAVCIGRADGEFVKELLDSGKKVKITLNVGSEFLEGQSENVVATLKAGNGDKNAKTVIIGAHFDGIDTPGANDNASGVAVMLEAARVIAREKLKCNVRFIAFGAEEIGLIGSTRYVGMLNKEDRENVMAMINLDMVGVGDKLHIHTLKSESDRRAADLAEVCAKKFGYAFETGPQRSSDHEPFENAGIPVAYLEYGPETVHHTDNDTVDKIQKDNLERVCNVVAAMVKEIGTNVGRYARRSK